MLFRREPESPVQHKDSRFNKKKHRAPRPASDRVSKQRPVGEEPIFGHSKQGAARKDACQQG